ncbi:DUF228 domain-containing protein (plasmid) [Borrelia parkeri]|uniref:DUF228 domain-containing protein n=1 Tax=Borrelia parkeri TaxID=141 RepID=UPI001FF6F5F6|nr:DUF228 domain-containing protein [Borrelia parkeri]UPA11694.1 DUF228 domain-containing protein [Borrelia parkeri]
MLFKLIKLIKKHKKRTSDINRPYIKNPNNNEKAVFSNNTDFRDKIQKIINAPGETNSSSKTTLEIYPCKESPYKKGVKLAFEGDYEPHVEPGGGDDLYGICSNFDDFTQKATVIPILGNTFQGYLIVKDSTIKKNDKLFFNQYGMLEKVKKTRDKNIYAIALSDSIRDEIQGHWLAEVKIH